MPQLVQHRHGASELGDGGDYLHGDIGDHLLVMIVMTLHWFNTESEHWAGDLHNVDYGDHGDDDGDNVACCGIHNVDANDADVHE